MAGRTQAAPAYRHPRFHPKNRREVFMTRAGGARKPARIGIEISPAACRVVQIDRPGPAEDAETIVRAFTRTPGPDEVTLAPYRRQPVAVVMWGLHGDHRQAVVTVGSYQRMRREAVNAARQAGVDTRQMLADIAPADTGKDGQRRPVVIALARTSDVAAAVRPLTSAGLRVRSIVTPALALMSLARLRRRLTAPGMVEAYVALEETTTAIALVREGALIAARELEWGYHDEQRQVRSRDDVLERLGAAIEEFFGDCGARPSAVAQVCVCGGLPELRSMTLALTARLDVEVEPLDSLFGIDADDLPFDDFRDAVAESRLAWAAAADWNAPINFLRERRRRLVKTVLTRAAVVAGVATGLGIAWRIQRSALLEPSKPVAKPSASVPVPPRARLVSASPPQAAPAAQPKPSAPAPPAPAPAQVVARPPAAASPAPVATAMPPVQRPALPPAPRVTTTARVPALPPPVVLTPVPEPVRPAPPREPQTSFVPAATPGPPPVRRPPPEEVPLPFEGTLGTILYGADRKLAIIDGRIVQVGDDVRGARVVEITPNSVLFRDRQGRLRRLTLEGSGK
jgi:hypothetical protein